MNWRGKRVLVTGACGFIGSHLVEALVERDASVRAFGHYNALGRCGWLDRSNVRSDIELVMGDVQDRDRVRSACERIEIVFHLAALIGIPYSYHAPVSYLRTNVEGTMNMLLAARELGVERLVQTSTSEVYGTAQYVPMDESHPLQGQSPYSASKIAADKMTEAFHRSFNVPVVTVRPFNTYGPRQSTRALIPTIITQLLDGETVRLGNTHPTRDLLFVADTVDGFIRAAGCPGTLGETVNLGTEMETSVGGVAKLISELMGKEAMIEIEDERVRPEASEVDRLFSSTTRAKTLMGWQAKHSLSEGLERTITWLKENRDRYRTTGYAI